MISYNQMAPLFKALGDPIRLQIIDMLSHGELCACDILENLSISQPTLSHHMKLLIKAELVKVERRATWAYYSLEQHTISELHQIIDTLTHPDDTCISFKKSLPGDCEIIGQKQADEIAK